MAKPTGGPPAAGRFGPAAWFGLVCLVTYAYFQPAPASNEISRFNLVRAIVEHGRLEVDPFADTTDDVAAYGGHLYSDKAPGSSFLAVPAYAIYLAILNAQGAPGPAFTRESLMRRPQVDQASRPATGEDRLFLSPAFRHGVYVCNLSTNVIAGAATAALVFWLLLSWNVGAGRALFAAVAFAWGSQNFAYSVMFFGHVLAGLGLFGGWILLQRAETARFRDPARATAAATTLAVAAGFFVGLAVFVELPAALGAVVLAGYAATAPRPAEAAAGESLVRLRVRRGLAFALGLVPGLLALFAYQASAFGGPFSTGYAHVTNPTFSAGMSQGLLGVGWPKAEALFGMFFGRQRGLFYLAPVMLVALIGLGQGLAAPRTRRPAIVAAAIFAAFVLMNAGYYMWWGGAALGPRHLVPAMPFMALGFAWLRLPTAQIWRRVSIGVGLIALAISVVNITAAVAVSPLVPWGIDVLLAHVYSNFAAGRIGLHPGSSNVGMMLGLKGVVSLLPLLLIAGLGIWLVVGELQARADGSQGRGADGRRPN